MVTTVRASRACVDAVAKTTTTTNKKKKRLKTKTTRRA